MLRACQSALQELDGLGFVVDAPCSRPRQMLLPTGFTRANGRVHLALPLKPYHK